MRKLLIFITFLILAGCAYNFDNAKVRQVKVLQSGRCWYELDNSLELIDECGKFQIGDTLKLTK